MTKCRDFFLGNSIGLFWGWSKVRKQFWSLPIYQKKKFLSIYLSCLFNFDQFEGHFGLFGAVPGYLGVGVGSENYFGVYSYILSTFVFWVTQNSLHFRYWPIQGHLGAIFGSFGVGVRSEICIGVSSYIRKKSFSKHCFILRFYFWPILGSFWAFWDCVGLFWVRGGVRKLFWGLLFYTINFCFLSNPKILVFFILTNFRVILDSLGLYWAILGSG